MEALIVEFLAAAFKVSPLLGFLAYAWWSERTERREAQKQKDLLFERTLTVNSELKTTIDKWLELRNRQVG